MIPKLEMLHFPCGHSIHHGSCELGRNAVFNVGTRITAAEVQVKGGLPAERALTGRWAGKMGLQLSVLKGNLIQRWNKDIIDSQLQPDVVFITPALSYALRS